jgi:hypothetical protein
LLLAKLTKFNKNRQSMRQQRMRRAKSHLLQAELAKFNKNRQSMR